jgi:hypothetical protein
MKRTWFSRIGAASAFISATALLLGMIRTIISAFQPGSAHGWLSLLPDNWLILIFKLHAGFSGVSADSLHGLNILDIGILTCVGVMCFGLAFTFTKAGKIWTLVAFALSLAAIGLFIATQIAGRSTVMLAVMIISIVMLKNKFTNRITSYAGICASVFLFVGDLTVGIHSSVITIIFGLGYVFLTTWLFLVAASASSKEDIPDPWKYPQG